MKIYLATEMGGTPFTDSYSLKVLRNHKCFITDKISEADVIVAHNHKKLLSGVVRFPKKNFLVWTNEPRYDTSFKNVIKLPLGLPAINIMNVYGSEVFWHNLHFLASYHFANENNLGIDINQPLEKLTASSFISLNKKDKVAALFTNTIPLGNKLIKAKCDIDLSKKRCEYAIEGHQMKILDIYGNRWPPGHALDNSGFGFEKNNPWWIEKIEILKHYKYNLCFENTAHPYYVTEKIWHAIIAYSLPIYNSFNSTINETFPDNSFIDANKFNDAQSLFDFVKSMKETEYLERLNCCIDVFNLSLKQKRENYELNANEIIEKIIMRIND